jgi:hypothetical protein
MKKILITLSLATILFVVATSCDFLGLDNKKYKIEVVSTSGGTANPLMKEVSEGDDFILYLIPDLGLKVDYLIINGEKIIWDKNTYNFVNVNDDYKVEIFCKKTLDWYIEQGKWKQDSLLIREQNGTWSHYQLWGKSGENQFLDVFLSNKRYNSYINGELKGDGDWSIDETKKPATLNWGGTIWKIDKLDNDSLNISKDDVYDDTTLKNDGQIKEKFSHLK